MEIYNDDCFNIFPKIADNSIDLFILDLPYANKKFGNCTYYAWDTPIDLNKMWIEIKRMMKPDAIIAFFCNTRFGFALIESNPKWFRYDLVWEKSKAVGFLDANRNPLRAHEMIYIFKKKGGTYNPQKTEGEPYKTNRAKDQCDNEGIYRKLKRTNKGNNKGERYPRSVLKFKSVSKGLHPTQKPTELCEWLIKSFSNEGDTVMDFTMGSGSTGEACKNTNRHFIGVEKDNEIFKKAEKRLSL
jgi:site-specific DNA-methyltransferase (adenine-specific)